MTLAARRVNRHVLGAFNSVLAAFSRCRKRALPKSREPYSQHKRPAKEPYERALPTQKSLKEGDQEGTGQVVQMLVDTGLRRSAPERALLTAKEPQKGGPGGHRASGADAGGHRPDTKRPYLSYSHPRRWNHRVGARAGSLKPLE